MKKILSILTILAICIMVSCADKYEDLVPPFTIEEPTGGIININDISAFEDKVTFKLQLFVADVDGNFVGGLTKDYFRVTSDGGNVASASILDMREFTNDEKGDYSACLLMDQSSSIAGTDPYDLRIDAAKVFVNAMGENEEIALASFPEATVIEQTFTNEKSILNSKLDSLRNNTFGGTPLFDAIEDMIDYVSTNAINQNKAVIAFTDGQASGSVSNASIELAQQNNINIYTIGLTDAVNTGELLDIAMLSGGAVFRATDALQLNSVFTSLSGLLKGGIKVYELTIEAKKLNGYWQSGEVINERVIFEIDLANGDDQLVNVQYPFEFKIP